MQQAASRCILLEFGLRDGSAAEQVRRSAARLGIEVRSSETAVEPGRTIAESLMRAMREVDFAVAVIRAQMPAQYWFEIGLAAAISRSLLLVLDGVEVAELPAGGMYRTVGPVLAADAMDRALRRALKPQPRPRGPASKSGKVLAAQRWQEFSATLTDELKSTSAGGANGARFEAWFGRLLAELDLPFSTSARVAAAERTTQYDNVDFAVSATELGPNIGDPMPVELVLGSANRVVRSRADSFDRYLLATGATTLLLVSLANEPPGIRMLANGEALWVSASSLLDELQNQTFGHAVLALRRRAIDQPEVGTK